MSPSPILVAEDIRVYFPVYGGLLRRKIGETHAVDGVSFFLERGRCLALIGESGSGKSTTARAVAGLLPLTSGRLELPELHKYKQAKASYVQLLFQDPAASLNPRRSIDATFNEVAYVHKLTEPQRRIRRVLDLVGLSESILPRYPHQFSGGQQQRICIARALLLEPQLLICDEVVSALDLSIQAQILNLLTDLQQELAISYLFIAHDLTTVRFLADKTLVMHRGKIVEAERTEQLFRAPQHPYTQQLLSAQLPTHPLQRGALSSSR